MNSNITRKFFTNITTLVLLFTISSCTRSSIKLSDSVNDEMNVVIVMIDTLRADHLPFYGYKKNTAPFLSTIAEKGIVFDRTFSTSSYTAPAVASMFTSLYPSQHKVITGHFANMRLQKKNPTVTFDRIPDQLVTLTEKMKESGYRTFGVADNLNVSEQMGFTQGFDKFATYRYEGAAKVNETVLSWSDEIKKPGKYYMYVHYMDPHEPYQEREPWFEPSDDKQQRIRNAYDSEINYTDKHIQELFNHFEWMKNSLVIVISDHGEEFWEHGQAGHGKNLYTEVIRIPFVIYAPGIKPIRIPDHTSIIDVLPTLSELLKFPVEEIWEGKSVVGLVDSQQRQDRSLFAELLRKPEHPRPEIRSVVNPDWQYITNRTREGALTEELYNIRTDFAGKKNVAAEKPEIAANLNKQLVDLGESKVHDYETHFEEPISEDGLKELRTLGYAE